MKNINLFGICLVALVIYSCNNANQAEETNHKDTLTTKENLSDTLVAKLKVLPKTNYQLTAIEPIIAEYMAHLESATNQEEYYAVIIDENNNLILQIGHEGNVVDYSYDLNVYVENPTGAEAILEMTDVNKDGKSNELAIWFNQSDGTNGIESGFEFEQKWLMIFDTEKKEPMLHLIFSSHHSNYSAGPNANTLAEDYHAKMADDSEWDICSFSYQLLLKNGEIQLSEYYFQKEGMGECASEEYQAGTYAYNIISGEFQLKK